MKQLTTNAGAMLALLTTIAAADVISVKQRELPLEIQKGDKKTVTYSVQRDKDGKVTTLEARGSLTVGDVGEDHFLATWVNESTMVQGVTIDKTHPKAASLFIGVPFHYMSGADGAPMKILDQEGLIDGLSNNELYKDNPAALEKLTGLFRSMSPENLAQAFLKVPSYLSLCQSMSLPLGQPLVQQVAQPSPFGGGELLTNISYTLESVDEKQQLAVIKYDSRYDADSLQGLTEQVVQQFARQGQEVDVADIRPDRHDAADCKVNLATGWVDSMTFATRIKARGGSMTEFYTISVR